MPTVSLAPAHPAEEIFPDDFRAQAFDLVPDDPTATFRAFEPVVLGLAMRATYIEAGLVPPLELILAAPSGRHETRELAELPVAIVFTPLEGGVHAVTVREQAHNQWWGQTTVSVIGEKLS